MHYALFAMAGLLVLLIGYWLMTRRTQAPTFKPLKTGQPRYLTPHAQFAKLKESGDKYWGYRVESHCSSSSRLAGRQYPLDELPPLPVEGCTSVMCECCLVGLSDQRGIPDRRTGQDRRLSLRMDATDRRDDRPRRKTDLNTWGAYGHL